MRTKRPKRPSSDEAGGRGSYRHPVEEADFKQALRKPKAVREQRRRDRVAANIERREREREEGLIP